MRPPDAQWVASLSFSSFREATFFSSAWKAEALTALALASMCQEWAQDMKAPM